MTDFKPIPGGVLAAKDFVAAAVHCGIKKDKLDLVMIHSLRPAAAAATVTQNKFRAAPTYVTQEAVADGNAQTIIANSGNANCATGEQGLLDAWRMAALAGNATGVEATEVIVCSTGHIGDLLPMDKVEAGIAEAAAKLSRDNAELAARGIMTTDSYPKSCAAEFEVNGVTCRIGGIAKGAGMIHPNMATMLCFLCTDVAIDAKLLRQLLVDCVEHTFNCITVDGDMSTNDTVAILANGAAENETLVYLEDKGSDAFQAALRYVCTELAKMIAFDGEGATKAVTIRVTEAESFEEARAVAKGVANYNLCKCMFYGMDFNWGRVAAAIGATLLDVDPARISIEIQGIRAWHRGVPERFDLQAARQLLRDREIFVKISLGKGDAEATVWTCDLTPEYITLNAEYESAEPA
jgi:glutamate N-acetyltransferase/amino-acid N-acetyltransferase